MTTVTIDRIGVVSLAKFYATIATALALVFGLPVLLVGAAVGGPAGPVAFVGVVGFGLIGGAIGGAFSALIYNAVATISGGLAVGATINEE